MDFIGYEQAVDIEEYSCAMRAFRDRRGWVAGRLRDGY
jgi:hypothetical protein